MTFGTWAALGRRTTRDYGYFVANYNDNGVPTSYIKRVPLAGGAATVLAKSPAYIGTRDLATDGTTLFWADASGIQRMPIGGGAVTTMYHGQKCSRIGLDSSSIYFTDGPYIARGSKTGGASGWETATSTVTALSVNEATRTVYWGEAGGAVRSRGYDSLVTAVVQAPIAGRDVTSVGFDGNRVLWTDCAEPGNTSCDVRYRPLGGWTSIVNAGTVGAGHLQWDSASLYWGDASALKKAVY